MLALFPLNTIVYPFEELNLHIFEPRYKQLIKDSFAQKTYFGIPAFLENRIEGYGTEMELLSITKEYEDGRMDIKTIGKRVFRLQSFVNPMPDRLYAGGEAIFDELVDDTDVVSRIIFLQFVRQLYELLQINAEFSTDQVFLSYRLAHKIGLSKEHEYKLLTMSSETERQYFLMEHIKNLIPIVEQIENTKKLIRLNGHFKHFDPLNF